MILFVSNEIFQWLSLWCSWEEIYLFSNKGVMMCVWWCNQTQIKCHLMFAFPFENLSVENIRAAGNVTESLICWGACTSDVTAARTQLRCHTHGKWPDNAASAMTCDADRTNLNSPLDLRQKVAVLALDPRWFWSTVGFFAYPCLPYPLKWVFLRLALGFSRNI